MESLRGRRAWGYTTGLLVFVGFVFSVAMLFGFLGQREQVDAMWIAATVQDDGSFVVTEVIDYDFGIESRRGIVRYVPELNADVPVSARSATAPDALDVSEREFANDTAIRIGDARVEIRGAHRYELTYGVEQVQELPMVALDAVGDGWSVPVRNVEVHLLADFELDNPWCSLAELGRTVDCGARTVAPGHIVVQVDEVEDRHILTVGAEVGASLGAEPTRPVPPDPEEHRQPRFWWFAPLAGTLAALIAIPPITMFIRRLGREQLSAGAVGLEDTLDETLGATSLNRADIATKAPLRYSPPADLSAAQGGVLLTERVLDHHVTAWFLDAAGRDELVIDRSDEITVLRPGTADSAGELSAKVIETLFSGRSEIKLSGYSPRVKTAHTDIKADLEEWKANGDRWSPAAHRRRVVAAWVAGVTIPIAGLAMVALLLLGFTLAALIAVAVTLVAAAVAARSGELESLTPEGTAQLIEVEGFRRYLEGDGPLDNGGPPDPAILRRHTAWAISLGVEDGWADNLNRYLKSQRGGAGALDDELGVGLRGELDFATKAAVMSQTLGQVSREPSSSGSGGSGGYSGGSGSSGSGGGGGGGGSW